MKNNIDSLKVYRTESNVAQQVVASLLDMDAGNLARYERGQHKPTLEILLTYHILFEMPIVELLSPLYKEVKRNIIKRSQKLLPELRAKKTPKSIFNVTYLENIVKVLTTENEHEEAAN